LAILVTLIRARLAKIQVGSNPSASRICLPVWGCISMFGTPVVLALIPVLSLFGVGEYIHPSMLGSGGQGEVYVLVYTMSGENR